MTYIMYVLTLAGLKQLVVVGGGAGGVELALSMHHYLGLPRADPQQGAAQASPQIT